MLFEPVFVKARVDRVVIWSKRLTCLCRQDFYSWPDESFEEMDSTLAVQQVSVKSEILFTPDVNTLCFYLTTQTSLCYFKRNMRNSLSFPVVHPAEHSLRLRQHRQDPGASRGPGRGRLEIRAPEVRLSLWALWGFSQRRCKGQDKAQSEVCVRTSSKTSHGDLRGQSKTVSAFWGQGSGWSSSIVLLDAFIITTESTEGLIYRDGCRVAGLVLTHFPQIYCILSTVIVVESIVICVSLSLFRCTLFIIDSFAWNWTALLLNYR